MPGPRPAAAPRAERARCRAGAGYRGCPGPAAPYRSCLRSSLLRLLSEEIHGTELSGGGAHERFAWLPRDTGCAVAAVVPDVADEVLDLLLHIDHASSHL